MSKNRQNETTLIEIDDLSGADLIRLAIANRHETQASVAMRCHISPQNFSNKLKRDSFTYTELKQILNSLLYRLVLQDDNT